ncbi:DNA polymerase III subunit delta' [Tissierella sp. MSJ-40]|uniref:DNA-directed DNA polymerase n=1 Tax=Tissierella simiarum TaxID=2841534 RepID=A0ABS6E2C4_9FIRM|nr:DNA polymerase III subunit delta' [Tissierella simiarum]MBU5437058.1 DNA polymerase III subunit delta' [Tissierella simiarum]
MDFNQIIGHENVIQNLKKSIEKGKVSHSYLFEGEESLGKKMVGLAFAKTLLCKEDGWEPCNKCSSCIKFDTGNHPDFQLIEPEKDSIKKEKMELLVKSITTAPFESKRKVFIIDDSHKITMEGQNAILKTLEEPPEFMNIILITSSSNKLLPTILSRCQGIKFYPVENSKIINLLVNKYDKIEEESKFIADFTKGSVGKSIELSISKDFFNRREEVIRIVDSILKGDKLRALTAIDFFMENKENVDEILDMLLYWFRDLIIYKEIGETDLIINKDKILVLSNQSFIDLNKINDIIEKIQETKVNIQRNVNFQLSLEAMLLNIQEV